MLIMAESEVALNYPSKLLITRITNSQTLQTTIEGHASIKVMISAPAAKEAAPSSLDKGFSQEE
jgi:hypothetical protein